MDYARIDCATSNGLYIMYRTSVGGHGAQYQCYSCYSAGTSVGRGFNLGWISAVRQHSETGCRVSHHRSSTWMNSDPILTSNMNEPSPLPDLT